MTKIAIPIHEFDAEMASTRRLLERVPTEKGPWKPHEKSFALGHLAQLVSSIPGWITRTLREPSLNLAGGGQYSFQPTTSLLKAFDENVRGAREALQAVRDEELDFVWKLMMGEQVLMSMPRGEVVRQHLMHLAHHRGQLTVYLRLIDVALPSIYGPTADEKWG
jgi:uncharacterized damage-inducible protein DinB